MATIEILNLNELIDKLDRISAESYEKALTKSCLLVENQAKIYCPVDTGELRASITTNISGQTGEVGTNMFYAPYVEYGTGVFAAAGNGRQDAWSYQDAKGDWHTTIGQRPQPFLEPSLNENKINILNIFKEAIEESAK